MNGPNLVRYHCTQAGNRCRLLSPASQSGSCQLPVPRVAIIGRPNVGKSSLFNWLAGRRISIVDPTAGVTRDRISTLIEHNDKYFELIDTGGIGIVDSDDLTEDVEKQIQLAIEQADVLLFVVDARSGRVSLDEEVNQRIRYVTKPVIFVANKCDSPEWDHHASDFYKFGRGKIHCVSAEQKRGREDLLEAITKQLPKDSPKGKPDNPQLKLAIVGRRNTGKSTFINSLAESDRVIVSEVAGTTRDSVDVRFERDGKTFIAIDTAGVRKKKSVSSNLEFYSMARAERSIRRADVVLMFFDPRTRVSKVDKTLTDYILQEHKPTIFVVNKWDLVKGTMPTERMATYLQQMFPMLDYVPVAFISAKQSKNVGRVLNLAQTLYKQASQRVNTGQINQVLKHALAEQSPPVRQNRSPKIYYATQVDDRPPTIILFTNGPYLFDNTYQRYLIKQFRDHLPFTDVPIRMYLRDKARDGKPAGVDEDTELAMPALEEGKSSKPPKLKFKTEFKEDEIKKNKFDSEIWRDL
jgi:GTPase